MTNFENVNIVREDKTIGVEIEFFGADRDDVTRALQRRGIKFRVEGWQNQKRFSGQWILTTDGSVTPRGTGVGRGLEIVSPPLPIAELERQLKLVTEALNEVGAKVDKTCGVHVHHHIDDFNLNQIKNIYRIYKKHEQALDTFFPVSRRSESNPRYCQGLNDVYMNRIENYASVQELQYNSDRYRVINFKSYVKYGTIEFRQHAGSTDFEKIFNWVLITSMIVATAKKKKTIKPLSENANPNMAFNKEIGIYNTVQGIYFRDRRKELANAQ